MSINRSTIYGYMQIVEYYSALSQKVLPYTNLEVIMPEEIRLIVYDYMYMKHGKPPCSYKQKAEE